MKLESLLLWEEKYLFKDQGEVEKGFVGSIKGVFDTEGLIYSNVVISREGKLRIHGELELLQIFLVGRSAGYLLRSLHDLKMFCWDKVHDHVPYSFDRECWGFRVLTEEYAWYIALTPWNPTRHVLLCCYNRKSLMTALAREKGLPEYCYGVLIYTGERICIRYGADIYESYPQYGCDAAENRAYANKQNAILGVSATQVTAMENGVIFGWNSPVANTAYYDKNNHHHDKLPKERRKKFGT